MPALPDVRPLIINLLSRYIIQCKLEGATGLPGQRSEEKWYSMLEALCLTVQPQTNLSHCTLQFMRYVSLLEQVCKLKEGSLDETINADILKLITNLSLSSELRDESMTEKLVALLQCTKSNLNVEMVGDYRKKVFDFVEAAMERYAVSPLICLSSDAFMPVVPSMDTVIAQRKKKQNRKQICGRKRCREPENSPVSSKSDSPAKAATGSSKGAKRGSNKPKVGTGAAKVARLDNGKQICGSKQPEEAPAVVKSEVTSPPAPAPVVESTVMESGSDVSVAPPAGVEPVAMEEVQTTAGNQPTSVFQTLTSQVASLQTLASNAAPVCDQMSASDDPKPSVRMQLDFDPPLPDYLPIVPDLKVSSGASLAGRITTPPSLSTAMVTNDDFNSIVHIVNVEVDEKRPIRACRRGIFDDATGSVEMGWSSDESAPIQDTSATEKDTPTKATDAGQFKFVTRKGAWSEEESRCLLEGVEKFGEGKWKEIRAEAYSILRYRTTNQLKDKYRNIKGRPK